MFFEQKTLSIPHDEIYRLTLMESMRHLNNTCRYEHPEESAFSLPPEEFQVNSRDVSVRGGVSITDALDALFHEIKSDLGTGPHIIDCLLANILVALQGARSVFGDASFNAYVDKKRGGRANPIILKEKKGMHPLCAEFGVSAHNGNNTIDYRSSKWPIFSYMLQPDPDAYTLKHDFLTSRGFHHIVLPDGTCIAFAPEVRGKFKNTRALAQYMVKKMNQDLSPDEWCAHATHVISELEKQHFKPHSFHSSALLHLAQENLNVFLEMLNKICNLYHHFSDQINSDFIAVLTRFFTEIQLPITPNDISFIVSFAMSLEKIISKNKIKVKDEPEVYAQMIKESQNFPSIFQLDFFTKEEIPLDKYEQTTPLATAVSM